jgi:hypothetical protein
MLFQFVINGFTLPNTANKPLVTIKPAAGKPAKLVRIDIGARAAASSYMDFRLRRVNAAETGGTAVNGTAVERDWTAAPATVINKGTFSVDPTLQADGGAGNEGGAFTFNALGFLPWSPPFPFRIPAGEEWALCTSDVAPTSVNIDITIWVEE